MTDNQRALAAEAITIIRERKAARKPTVELLECQASALLMRLEASERLNLMLLERCGVMCDILTANAMRKGKA